MGRIRTSRVQKKRKERARGIRIKMNRIKSRFFVVTKRLYQRLLRKHQANAVKNNNCINREEKKKGKNQQNGDDKGKPES